MSHHEAIAPASRSISASGAGSRRPSLSLARPARPKRSRQPAASSAAAVRKPAAWPARRLTLGWPSITYHRQRRNRFRRRRRKAPAENSGGRNQRRETDTIEKLISNGAMSRKLSA